MATDADGDSATLNFTLAVATANAVGVTRVDFIGTPRTGDTYGAGEEIWVRVSLTAIPGTVSITGSPRLGLTIGSHVRQAFYDAHLPNALYFIYRVRGSDVDLDGIDIADNALTLNGATLRAGGVDFNLDLAAAAIGSCNCKVNGGGLTFTAAVAPQRYTVNAAGQTTLPAATGGSGAVRYRLGDTPALPRGLSFDRSTRVISGTPTTTSLATEYELIATDAADSTATLNFQLSVEEQPRPVFTQEIGAQRYRKDRAIYVGLPAATGGTGALAYGLRPELPAGLTYNGPTDTTTGGAIVGMPTVTLTETAYALTATDEDGDEVAMRFAIAVVENARPVFTRTVNARYYAPNVAVETTLPAATGGDGALRYALGPDLPAGLTFNAVTRVISGTPAGAADATTYALTARDADGDAARLAFSIEIAPNTTPSFGSATVEAQSYEVDAVVDARLVAATGGNGALRYNLMPALPAGLTFDDTAPRIYGRPGAASPAATYALTATDVHGDAATLRFALAVTFTDLTPTFGEATVGAKEYARGAQVVLILPAATGGNGALRYRLGTAPALPTGLAFDETTLAISGRPGETQAATTYALITMAAKHACRSPSRW